MAAGESSETPRGAPGSAPQNNVNGRRVIRVYPHLIFQMESKVVELLGSGGSVVMIQEGKTYMSGIIEQLKTLNGPLAKDAFLRALTDELKVTGWGDYRFDIGKLDQRLVVLEGTDLPFKHESTTTYNWFLMGMLSSITESLFGASINLRKSEWLDGNRIRVELELGGKTYLGPASGPKQ